MICRFRLHLKVSTALGIGLLASAFATEAAGLVVDHHSVALFDQIPPESLAAARNLRVLFSDRSVGQNINEALDCLAATSWAESPAACRRDYYTNWLWKTFTQADRDAGLVPARILFDPDPVRYSRTNWTFEFRSGSWSELTQDFIQSLAPQYLATKDVLSDQFSYLNGLLTDGSADFADTDHDGLDNYGEWVAGTNPTNSVSRFEVQGIRPSAPTNAIMLQWLSVTGRVYRVSRRTNLSRGEWTLVANNLPAAPPVNAWTNALPAEGEEYYRLEVVRECP